MKILLITALYDQRSPSGENEVFYREKKMLEGRGNIVETYITENSNYNKLGKIGLIKAFFDSVWNWNTYFKIKEILKKEYDLVHIHNTFPSISLSIIFGLRDFKKPIFITLHNYRFFCLRGVPFRNGSHCLLCLEKHNTLYGLQKRCYRNSLLASFPVYLSTLIFKSINKRYKNIKYITLTLFQKEILTRYHMIEAEKIFIKHHFINHNVDTNTIKNNDFIFAGRLSFEKGVFHMLKEWNLIPNNILKLKIAGNGPLYTEIVKTSLKDKNIEVLGSLENKRLLAIIRDSKYLIFPSECYETFGLALIEALSVRTPVIAANIGSVSEIIKDRVTGFLYNPNNEGELAKLIQLASELPTEEYNKMQEACTTSYSTFFSESSNYKRLMEIYEND